MKIAFIPARGGSKRIPDKNLQLVGDRSLLQRAVDVGLETCDRVVVSTESDRVWASLPAYAKVTRHVRPEELASDDAQIEDAIAHWMLEDAATLEDADVIALLQPSSPFRSAETVAECIDLASEGTAVSASPYHTVSGLIDVDGKRSVLLRGGGSHQSAVREDGVCWAFTVGHFRTSRTRCALTASVYKSSRFEAIEIDTTEDLIDARYFAELCDRADEET